MRVTVYDHLAREVRISSEAVRPNITDNLNIARDSLGKHSLVSLD